MPPTDVETAHPQDLTPIDTRCSSAPREGAVPQRRHDVRCLALPGDHGCVRGHGRRGSGDQGAGNRSVRHAVPRGRVHGARLRLPPSRGERRSAAADRPHRRTARRLARRDPTSPAPCPRSTRRGSRSGASRSRAATSSPSRPAAPVSPQRSRRRRSSTARPPRPAAMRHTTTRALLRLTGRGLLDAVGGRLGREPLLVPLAGPPGTVAMLTTPDALNGDRALNPDNRYPDWQQEIAARSALRIGFYRPGRAASRVECPLLVLAYDQDDVGAGRRRRPRRRARSPAGGRPPAGRALRAVPGRSHTGRRPPAVLPARAPARRSRDDLARSSCPPGRSTTRTPAATAPRSSCSAAS